eukprot:6705398-Prorocentrum_lima.AAC.1
MKTFLDKSLADFAKLMDNIEQDSRLHKIVKQLVEVVHLSYAILISKIGRRELDEMVGNK